MKRPTSILLSLLFSVCIVQDKDGKVISEDFEMYNFESELSKILAKK